MLNIGALLVLCSRNGGVAVLSVTPFSREMYNLLVYLPDDLIILNDMKSDVTFGGF